MNIDDEEKFRKAFNVRRCEKCCGNCKHFEREYECAGCAHPKQAEFDLFLKAMLESDLEYREDTEHTAARMWTRAMSATFGN